MAMTPKPTCKSTRRIRRHPRRGRGRSWATLPQWATRPWCQSNKWNVGSTLHTLGGGEAAFRFTKIAEDAKSWCTGFPKRQWLVREWQWRPKESGRHSHKTSNQWFHHNANEGSHKKCHSGRKHEEEEEGALRRQVHYVVLLHFVSGTFGVLFFYERTCNFEFV